MGLRWFWLGEGRGGEMKGGDVESALLLAPEEGGMEMGMGMGMGMEMGKGKGKGKRKRKRKRKE